MFSDKSVSSVLREESAPRSERHGRRFRVLIVSPHFPPVNAPDHQRVRVALPYLAQHGWDAEILAVHASNVETIPDYELARALSAELIVHRVGALPARLTRRLGVGSLALRSYRHLRRRGDALLATGRFDLVFFSTTQFGVLPLGPSWKRRHAVPYVLDFQDEWVGDYYRQHPKIAPPGGRLKYVVSRWLAKQAEPRVIQQAAQVISVSPAYNDAMRARYPNLPAQRFHELPFGGAEDDFTHLRRSQIAQDLFCSSDGRKHWVYVGRGGPDMSFAVGAFFVAVRRALKLRILKADEVRVHFIGTSYAPSGLAQESFVALARTYGLQEIVTEHTARIPYFTALQCLRQASAVLVFGSDDSGYTASKLFPALLSKRPLLSVLHEKSHAVEMLRKLPGSTLVTFSGENSSEKVADQIFRRWIFDEGFKHESQINDKNFAPFSGAEMTRRLCGIFDAARLAMAAPS